MTSPSVPCYAINEQQRDRYLHAGFNPCSASDDQTTYRNDWYKAFDELKSVLSRRWRHAIGDGDFFVLSNLELDRFLNVEVTNEAMLEEELLATVHDVVARRDKAYSVDICDAWGFLKRRDGQDWPHFNIFVERSRILIYTESPTLLARLGLQELP